MKTLITSTGNKKSANFDLRFGRAAWFCIYDDISGSIEFIENTHMDDGHGAGPKAAEKAYELGAERIISGDFGPKAKDLLDKLNIQMIIIDDQQLSIKDVIKKIQS